MPEHPQLACGDLGTHLRIVGSEPLDDPIDAQILVIARDDLMRAAITEVEQHEVFHDIQQAPTIQHALQQDGQ
ncbi:hypothetical protein D3C77_759920 [compost metagenome]